MRRLHGWGVLGLLAAAGCGEPADVTTARTEIQGVIASWHDAYDNGDVDALEAMLDPEVSFPVPPDQFLHGSEAVAARIKKDVEDYVLKRDFQGKRKTRYGQIHTTVSGSLAVARYDVTISDPGGVSLALYTRVFRKSGSKWLLLVEHYTVTSLETK